MENTDTKNTTTAARMQTARHLAARAVVALRARFCVERIGLDGLDTGPSGITCDWRQAREGYGDDEKLVTRGFAFAYVGSIIDQKVTEPLSDSVQKELSADMSVVLEAGETAVQWGLVSNVRDTHPFAHGGYKLASRLIKADETVIDCLATYLLERDTVDEQQLLTWFESNSKPLSLEEMEQSITF